MTNPIEYLVICENKNDVTYFFAEIRNYAFEKKIRVISNPQGYTIYFLEADVKVRFVSRYIYELFARIGARGEIVKDEIVRKFIEENRRKESRNGSSL